MAGAAGSPHCGSHGGDPESQGCRPEGTRFRMRLGASFAVRQRAITAATGNTLCRQTYDLGTSVDGRKHSRRDFCACWFRKIAAMAWYRVELERPPQFPPVQDFLECHPNLNPQMLSPEILVSVGHPSLRRAEAREPPACCSCPSRAVTRCSDGVLLSYCELSKRHGDAPTTATIRRFTARPGCFCWLLFADIRPPCSQKARISAAYVNSFAVLSLHISENSGSGSGGELR